MSQKSSQHEIRSAGGKVGVVCLWSAWSCVCVVVLCVYVVVRCVYVHVCGHVFCPVVVCVYVVVFLLEVLVWVLRWNRGLLEEAPVNVKYHFGFPPQTSTSDARRGDGTIHISSADKLCVTKRCATR